MSDELIARLQRAREQWANCEPEVMACMSEGAIFHALTDAKHDVLAMHEALKGAAVIADAAGAEIRALKARIADLEARTGEVNIGEVKAMSWLIIQPNGRSYVVGDVNKVSIARNCGYAVQAIVDTHPPTGDAAGKDEIAKKALSALEDAAKHCLHRAAVWRKNNLHDAVMAANTLASEIRAMRREELRAIASLTKTADGENKS